MDVVNANSASSSPPAAAPTRGPSLDSAERLRAIVETAVDGIITIDSNGIVETMNPAAVRMFGHAPEQMIGRNITALMPEPFRSEHDAYLRRYLTTGERRIIGIGREVLGQRRDGSTFPMELAVSEMRLDGRRMFTGIVRDVTERRAAEEKMRRLAALLDDSNDAIETFDLEGNITAWNHGAERLYGYPAERALQLNVRDLLPQERCDEIHAMIARLVAGDRVAPFETQRVTADGRLVHIQCTMTLLKGRGEQRDAVVVTDRDITERKQAEAALRGSEAKTRAIVEAAVDGIITIDADGLVESVNRAAEQLFGYSAAELIGGNVNRLMPSPYHEEHDGYIRRYQRTGVKKIIGIGREVVGRRKDGSTFPMELAISEMTVGDRRMFTGIVRDISERKLIERELKEHARAVAANNVVLQEAMARAEDATATKSAFLANISHEIRTPMTAILGFAERLQDDHVPPSERRYATEAIRRHGEYLMTLLNDILDLSKIEAGKLETERIPVSLARLVGDVASLLRVRADAKLLTLSVECRTPVPTTIETDPTRLQQILVNLVSNAIKFTSDGGVRVVLAFEPTAAPPQLTIDVVDTGIGLSEAQCERLFEPFVQADNSTTRRYGGSGLGLAISQRLAGLLGGTIEVHSEPGAGSCFRFRGPLQVPAGTAFTSQLHEACPTPAAERRPPAAPLHGARLLLAEDGPDNQLLIGSLLRRAGAEVEVVDNGRVAVERVLRAWRDGQPFDVVLMDIQMPELDGYDATRQLRENGYERPIVALTAHAMSGDRERCLQAGCTDYASKPIDRATLLRTIGAQLDRTAPGAP